MLIPKAVKCPPFIWMVEEAFRIVLPFTNDCGTVHLISVVGNDATQLVEHIRPLGKKRPHV